MRTNLSYALCVVCLLVCAAAAQQSEPAKPVIFAVINNGTVLEPIAYVEDGKLESAIDGASEADVLKSFHGKYFKPKVSYPLIFGGAKAGLVAIKSSDPTVECAQHTADVFVESPKVKLKGNVMGLAVSGPFKFETESLRRAPTANERAEIDRLVRAEFAKKKISTAVIAKMRSRNLTAVDVDRDDLSEFVGSYWVAPTAKSRALLFFVAERDENGQYAIVFSQFDKIDQKDTMSEDITSVDGGVYAEILIDVFDYDQDGTAEIFTFTPSFEGDGFNAYRREGKKWTKSFEAANYRCAY